MIAEHGLDCVESGYLLFASGIEQLMAGDTSTAVSTFAEVPAIERRFGDPNLLAMVGFGRGRALVRLGQIDEGMAALDEVMVAVKVSPLTAGQTCCGVLEAC